jgi:hypothetical protein
VLGTASRLAVRVAEVPRLSGINQSTYERAVD